MEGRFDNFRPRLDEYCRGIKIGAVMWENKGQNIFRSDRRAISFGGGSVCIFRDEGHAEENSRLMTAGSFEEFDHTADAGIRARGDTLAEMLIAAAHGMLQLMFSGVPESPARPEAPAESGDATRHSTAAVHEHSVAAEADDAEQLLHAWLSELLFRLTVDRSVPVGFDVEECTPRRIRVRMASVPMDERMAGAATEIKAVTWHGLRAEHTLDGWIGEVIFDT